MTFCQSCQEVIPAKAQVCFSCGHKQAHAEAELKVVFCRRCGEDYPAASFSCLHCGLQNPLHPLARGKADASHVADSSAG